MTERWGALPLGELHAEGICYRCGAQVVTGHREPRVGDISGRTTLHRGTLAYADVCSDPIACERRRYNKTKRI